MYKRQGETLHFPTNTEEVQSLLKRIGVDGVRCQEYFIISFDSDILGLYDYLGEYETVSYTHLDVYKRQLPGWSLPLLMQSYWNQLPDLVKQWSKFLGEILNSIWKRTAV